MYENYVITTEQRWRAARGMQQTADAVDNELEQIAHRTVVHEFDRQLIQNAGALRASLFFVDFDREIGRVRVAVDRNELRDRLVRVKDDFAVAEGDAIACAEGDGVDDLDTIDERSIDAAAVAHVPRPAIE